MACAELARGVGRGVGVGNGGGRRVAERGARIVDADEEIMVLIMVRDGRDESSVISQPLVMSN